MGAIWDGLVGAVIGGFLAATATFLTVRWQTIRLLADERGRAREAREEERRDWLRRREEQALAGLLVVLNEVQGGVWELYGSRSGMVNFGYSSRFGDKEYRAEAAYNALLHGLRVDLPLIADTQVRSRFAALVGLVDEVRTLRTSADERETRERQEADVVRFIGYVRHSVKRALHGQPLPQRADAPVLTRVDGASWTPPEMDPEDSYFPDAQRKAVPPS